jgi:hypothetical protein
MLRTLPYLLLIALWIYALVDCLGTPPAQVRGLPKGVWVLIVLLLGEILVGPLAWLLLGKRRPYLAPYGAGSAPYYPRHAGTHGYPLERPQPDGWVAPDDNPEFLRSLADRIQKPDAPDD